MEAMPDESTGDQTRPDQPESVSSRSGWLRTLKATSARRALLLTALGGLLIAGLTTALPFGRQTTGPASYLEPTSAPLASARGNSTFAHAKAGDCLNWGDKTPDDASIVDCKDDHQFEVAASVDMSTFPGSEYGPGAVPPSPVRIQQITQEQCQVAVQHYLGPKFDPNSRFAVSMLWPGDLAWKQSGERTLLCGVQLPGPDSRQIVFKGRVADIDQSKVWPAGTCLGIDAASSQQTDVPVECASPHAMEITGVVNLAEKFPNALPSEADQDAFSKEACTRMTDLYLAPIQLRNTTLTLTYGTLSLPSWSAGSRQVSLLHRRDTRQRWLGHAVEQRQGTAADQRPATHPPPDIPQERLNLPMPDPDAAESPSSSSSGSGLRRARLLGIIVVRLVFGSSDRRGSSGRQSDSGQQTQHIPQRPATQAPATQPERPRRRRAMSSIRRRRTYPFRTRLRRRPRHRPPVRRPRHPRPVRRLDRRRAPRNSCPRPDADARADEPATFR